MNQSISKIAGAGAIIIVALALGFGLGYVAGQQTGSAKLAEVKKFFPPIPEFQSISGTVKSVSGDTIVIEATAPFQNPFEELPAVRSVKVDPGTAIVKLAAKDSKEYEEEFADYQKKISAPLPPGAAPLIPPQPFVEEKIALEDIKAGDWISVEADESIKTKAVFTATRIVLQGPGQAVGPGPAAAPPPAGVLGGVAPPAPAGSPAAEPAAP